jgi:aryl-alcohol dehydrogenase-like predicted oxidoreductase
MQRRSLGNTGLWVSPLALGAGALGDARLSEREAQALIQGALDLGINLFDTAISYGLSEERLGRHLAGREAIVSTKGGYGVEGVPDWSAEAIRLGIDRALRALKLEQLGIFHLHSCPMQTLVRDELHQALSQARSAGKIRVIAYSGDNAELAWAISSGLFGSVQASLSLFDQRNSQSLSNAQARSIGALAKRPLGCAPWRGHEPHDDASRAYRERMQKMALKPGTLGWDELAVRFGAFFPGVTALLVGTTQLAHLSACARALEQGPLATELSAGFRQAFSAADDGWVAMT